MAAEKLTIPLTSALDRQGNKYYMGRVQFPGNIDLRDGAVFMVFVSEEGNEEIQIGVMDHNRERRYQPGGGNLPGVEEQPDRPLLKSPRR